MTGPAPARRAAFDALIAALADAFAREGRPGGEAAAAALRAAPGRPYRRLPGRSEPRALVEAACALPGALPTAASVLACLDLIAWSNWQGSGLAADVSAGLHFAELVGPDGHVLDDGVRVGLLVSEAGIDYPVSSHSGEETYLVLAGTAEWVVGDGPYLAHRPGTLIFHPAWAPHGRRTLGEPFLGAWRWSGDLDLSSFRLGATTR